MKKILFVGIVLFLLVNSGALFAEDVPVFGDSDLQKYENKNDFNAQREDIGKETRESINRTPAGSVSERKSRRDDQDYWCDQGRSADDRIVEAERNFSLTSSKSGAIINTYGSRYVAAGAVNDSLQAAVVAKKELEEARRAKTRLHEDAHRMGIPAGWLRCQFE